MAGNAAAPRLGFRRSLSAGLAVLAALVWFALDGQDRLSWARLLPWEGVAVLGRATLPEAALLCGLFAPALRAAAGRRAAPLVAVVLTLSAYQSLRPLVGAPPETGPARWSGRVCLQTSEATCSASSAATMLAHAGIATSEPELARLCLTRETGTPMLGVYRGLRRKARGTGVHVAVFTSADVAALKLAAERGPVLISVGLDRWPRHPVDARYEREWGWTPGRRHAVVVLGFLPGGRVEVGDPAVGREVWKEESLSVLWHGEGLQLVPGGAR